uniref:VWFA domain-containing protein n=1 Tax=Strigamia maritima TaxID=126957 RepID=T1J4G4_STRMM
MAAGRWMLRLLLIILLFFPDNTTELTDWQVTTPRYVNDLATALVSLMNRTTDINRLETIYGDLTGAELKQVSKNHLLKKMAKDVGAVFGERTAALRKLIERAEHAVTNHFNPTNGDVSFINMKKIDDNVLKYNPNFKTKVDLSTSAVHIPDETSEKDPVIENEIRWSAMLDKTFKRNRELYSDLNWQYFGSRSGMMRVYPASKWRNAEDAPDPYDVRRRPWYIEASTSPKDMLIMIDTSGNIGGRTLHLMKMSVKSLLNTLGENDYVNIAVFSETVEWISCFHTLVQASTYNKQVLFEAFDRIEVKGETASYTNALEFAFKEFKKKSVGSDCHKVLSIFTYGDSDEDPHKVYMAENNQTLVRIFTYAIGRSEGPFDNIKAMACNNKGYFSSIQTLDAIPGGIQNYINVLRRPMVLPGGRQFEWSNFYNDVMSLEKVTALKLPVYNRSIDDMNQSFVGVIGIDIPVKELESLGPNRQLGPVGYSFAINHNGFVVFHPNMKTEADYLDDPLRVDLLRRKMIDKLTEFVDSKTIQAMPNWRYVYLQEKTYFYTAVANTPLSIALVFPTDRNYYLNIDAFKFNVLAGLGAMQKDIMVIAPWPFCHGYPDDPDANLVQLIKEGNCNKDMVLHLLWDIQKTKSLPHTWRTLLEKNSFFSDYVKTIFLGTEGGLTRIYPESYSSVKKFRQYADTWNADYYRRAIYAKNSWVFSTIIDPGLNGNGSRNIIQAVRSVTTKDKKIFIPGVVGVQFAIEGLVELLVEGNFEALGLFGTTRRLSNYKIDQLPCNQNEVICYLVDDGGYIVVTSQYNNVETLNKFLGDVDPELMWVLYENQIFARKKTFNYQALCSEMKSDMKYGVKDAIGGASRLFLWSVPSQADIVVGPVNNEPCVTVQHQYYFGKNTSYVGDFSCNACYRKISAMRMQGTNLLFVAIDAPCSLNGFICSDVLRLHQKPERVPPEQLCKRTSRYRKRPNECYAFDNR